MVVFHLRPTVKHARLSDGKKTQAAEDEFPSLANPAPAVYDDLVISGRLSAFAQSITHPL